MTKQHIPVYFEEFQSLVLCRLDSLIIARNQNYENYQINIRYRRSSSQRRLCRVSQLLRSQLRIQAIGRGLQDSRPYLDELTSYTRLHRRDVRQPHTHQRQGRQSSPSNPPSLTNALHATQSEDSISSFLLARGCFFPLATKLSTHQSDNNHTINKYTHETKTIQYPPNLQSSPIQ